jgi:hypothetical protein
MISRELLTLCFAAAAPLACAPKNKRVRPVEEDHPPATYPAFAGAKATGLGAPDGQPFKS